MTTRRFLGSALTAFVFLSCSFVAICATNFDGEIKGDAQLRAMLAELARAKTLQLNNLEKPYFVSFASGDSEQAVIAASLGGLTTSNFARVRQPQVEVRVGSYAFDNTNSIYSRSQRGGLLPLDDDVQAMRTSLWLSADSLYKSAVDEITRKRNALREIVSPDQTPDFAPAASVQLIQPLSRLNLSRTDWEDRIRRLSARFASHSNVAASSVRLFAAVTNYRLVNTEGTVVRIPEDVADLEIRANGLAPDGARVWVHRYLNQTHVSELPPESDIAKLADEAASQIEALKKAPVMEDYSGPVLFDSEAAAGLVAQLMTDAIRLRRKPVAPPEASTRAPLESVWASRVGSKVAPDWLTIVDDPTQDKLGNKGLAGSYPVDDQGVPPSRVTLVEDGTLRNFLLSREPVRSFNASNGHGRLPAAYGAEAAVIGNLFVLPSQKTPESEMKGKLIERVKEAGLKYGIRIQSLDFPSTADMQDLEDIVQDMQKNGYARTITAPLLAFRVYPDGREELVRGARFREVSAKNLRDLEFASDTPYVLNYVNNGSAFGISGASSEATTSSVICPSLLIDGLDMGPVENESTKPPVVPPPPLVAE